jgi:hypothetical protein
VRVSFSSQIDCAASSIKCCYFVTIIILNAALIAQGRGECCVVTWISNKGKLTPGNGCVEPAQPFTQRAPALVGRWTTTEQKLRTIEARYELWRIREILAKVGDHFRTHPIESLCDSFFAFYSLWTLTWFVAYFTNLSLSAISTIFFLLLPLSVLALAFKPPATDQVTSIAASHIRRDSLSVLVFVIAGIFLTLFLHRPDTDDQTYLGMAFSLLANADQPIQQLPGYAGFDPLHSTLYEITAYEPLKAMVSYITGLPLLDSYYLLVPALMSALTVVVTYRLLRELVPEGWIIGLLFFFVVMLAWGDTHWTLANFGFVRMFQGKSVLVSAVVPALFLYFLLLRKGIQARYQSFLLVAVVISGVGFSRGGLIIGPLVFLFLALASVNFKALGRWSKTLLFFAATSAAVILTSAYRYGWNLMNPEHLAYTSRGSVVSTTNLEIIGDTMGHGARGLFLLTCVGVSFLFIKDKGLRDIYRNFLAIFFLLLLIPWTSDFFGKTVQQYLTWRWVWITPVPVLASITVGGALARIRHLSNSAVALGIFVILVVGFATASPRRVLSGENCASLRWPSAKLDGDSIYLTPYQKAAAINGGKLYLEGYERGF